MVQDSTAAPAAFDFSTLFYDDYFGVRWDMSGQFRTLTWSTVDDVLDLAWPHNTQTAVARSSEPYLEIYQQAFDLWDAALDTISFEYVETGNAADITLAITALDGRHGNEAFWTASWDYPHFTAATIQFDVADIDQTDVLTAALHEIGNILGLGDILPGTHYRSVQEDPWPENFSDTTLWADDVAFIRAHYGETGTAPVEGGDSRDNHITLDGSDNLLAAGGGDDEVLGNGGEDWLLGGTGDDTLRGGADNDILEGDAGDDMLYGGAGRDLMDGGDGADMLYGGASEDTITGGAGDDTLGGGDGDDTLAGGAGKDVLRGSYGRDLMQGDEGNDTLRGGGHDDVLQGGAGNDALFGGAGRDLMDGGDGADKLSGGASEDTITGGAGDDTLGGGDGDDTLAGGTGMDVLRGSYGRDLMQGDEGNDTLRGGGHDDVLHGGGGHDALHGGSGADILEGGAGNDTLRGGSGSDAFVFDRGFDSDRVVDFDIEMDRLEITTALAAGRSAEDIVDLAALDGADVILDFGDDGMLRLIGLGSLTGLADQIDIV